VFIKEGEIVERGGHANLVQKKGHYYNLLQYHNQNEAEVETTLMTESERRQSSSVKSSPRKKSLKPSLQIELLSKKLTEDDTSYKFAGFKSYILYLQACGGFFLPFLAFLFLLMFALARIFAAVWIQIWIDAGDGKMVSSVQYEIGKKTIWRVQVQTTTGNQTLFALLGGKET
jgi:hypothetical protein